MGNGQEGATRGRGRVREQHARGGLHAACRTRWVAGGGKRRTKAGTNPTYVTPGDAPGTGPVERSPGGCGGERRGINTRRGKRSQGRGTREGERGEGNEGRGMRGGER